MVRGPGRLVTQRMVISPVIVPASPISSIMTDHYAVPLITTRPSILGGERGVFVRRMCVTKERETICVHTVCVCVCVCVCVQTAGPL